MNPVLQRQHDSWSYNVDSYWEGTSEQPFMLDHNGPIVIPLDLWIALRRQIFDHSFTQHVGSTLLALVSLLAITCIQDLIDSALSSNNKGVSIGPFVTLVLCMSYVALHLALRGRCRKGTSDAAVRRCRGQFVAMGYNLTCHSQGKLFFVKNHIQITRIAPPTEERQQPYHPPTEPRTPCTTAPSMAGTRPNGIEPNDAFV